VSPLTRKLKNAEPSQTSSSVEALLNRVPAVLYVEERPTGACNDGRPVFVNSEVEKLLGYPSSAFLAGSTLWYDLILPEDRDKLSAPVPHLRADDDRVVARSEYRMRTAGGRVIWVRDEATVSASGKPGIALWQGVVTDVTNEHEIGDKLRFAANHDSLTDLPNRAHLRHALNVALRAGDREGDCFSLLFMDLDDFKHVNDTLGHATGDELLILVAARLRKLVRDGDTVARLGGDEFAVILPRAEEAVARAVAMRINESLREPFVLANTAVSIGCSIGIACYPFQGAITESEMMRLADLAMYSAKRRHVGIALYDPSDDDPIIRAGLTRRDELRVAVEKNQFVLFFQPLLNLHTDSVDAVEALIRWQHPVDGLLSPGAFLPLAEQIGLIRRLDLFALDAACTQAAAWKAAGRSLRVAINISRTSLIDETFSTEVAGALLNHGLEGPEIEIEITEVGAASDPRASEWFAERLAAMGVRLSIDDFGTGSNSLTQFRRLQASTLKVDKSFIDDVTTDEANAGIVEWIIALGRRFKRCVVAEGIETAEQLAWVRAAGADYAQGYFVNHALSVADFDAWHDQQALEATDDDA
jgi:diguanylate cyclase (GGDEF)-like protein/PAS domain S-box-containing protein